MPTSLPPQQLERRRLIGDALRWYYAAVEALAYHHFGLVTAGIYPPHREHAPAQAHQHHHVFDS